MGRKGRTMRWGEGRRDGWRRANVGKGGNKRKGKESERNRDCKVIKTSRQRGQDLDFQQGQSTKPRTGPSSCRLSPAELTPGFRDGLGLF